MSNENNTNPEVMIQQNSQALQIPPEVYLGIVKESIRESSQGITYLENAIQGNDVARIEAVSHQFKGVFGNLRITTVSVPATQINELAKQEGNLDQIKKLFPQLKSAFEKLSLDFSKAGLE
ncbi:MAG: Hpt domain-containing protein [Candidatus Omnitrophica bacterium]|nr:Hpt domain-containing protein [Candidatus Omnitrophota bacterium]